MSGRKEAQKRINSIQISATIDRELYDFLEDLEFRRMVRSRSHALNLGIECLRWMLQHNPNWFIEKQQAEIREITRSSQQLGQSRQQLTGKDSRFPR